MIYPRTPQNLNPAILSFCHEIAPGETPVFLPIEAVPHATLGDCFANVQKQVVENGGASRLGWKITTTADLLMEAEFHAVWLSPEEKLRDISPDPNNEMALFVLDKEEKQYQGVTVNSKRKALVDTPLVNEYIDMQNKMFELLSEDEVPYVYEEATEILPKLQPTSLRIYEILQAFENQPVS